MSMHAKTAALLASADQAAASLYESLEAGALRSGCLFVFILDDLFGVCDVILDDPAAIAEMSAGKRNAIQTLLLLGLSDFVRRYDAELTAMVEGAQ